MDFEELHEEWCNEHITWSNEGERGVENLRKLVQAIGYRSQYNYGNNEDIIGFLTDNPGAVEAVRNWIIEQNLLEWRENIESELTEKE